MSDIIEVMKMMGRADTESGYQSARSSSRANLRIDNEAVRG